MTKECGVGRFGVQGLVLLAAGVAMVFASACAEEPVGDRAEGVEPASAPAPVESARDGGAMKPASTECDGTTAWTCSGSSRQRCNAGTSETEACAAGCFPQGSEGAHCADPAPTWSCSSSSYQGSQYWTCSGSSLFRCDSGTGITIACANGCEYGASGTDDTCSPASPAGGAPAAVKVPAIKIVTGGVVTDAAVRGPIEDGVRYEMQRLAQHNLLNGKTAPTLTVIYYRAGTPYATGFANDTSTEIGVPAGYPLTGNNQNYVVNITLHEIGHLLAHHLIASGGSRRTSVNEGLASWIAGKYWMNSASRPVASLREAARREIARTDVNVYATMTNDVSASDAWYKVYASFFEYLESNPAALRAVSRGEQGVGSYTSGWAAWLR